jgi:hypothetical protein
LKKKRKKKSSKERLNKCKGNISPLTRLTNRDEDEFADRLFEQEMKKYERANPKDDFEKIEFESEAEDNEEGNHEELSDLETFGIFDEDDISENENVEKLSKPQQVKKSKSNKKSLQKKKKRITKNK